MGPGKFFLTPVRSGPNFVSWVRSAIFVLGLDLENFSLKSQNFKFFPIKSKKISSCLIKKYPGQRRVNLLFTVGQKYARVGSGSISSDNYITWKNNLKKLLDFVDV